jgi:hypothetical protein
MILRDTLTILSNDDNFPSKQVFLDGVWQKLGEGSREPRAQEIITTFDFKTKTGFASTDPDFGDSTKLKGDEIKPSYFVRANPSYPVVITQMASYHSCCISPEKLQWYTKGSSTLTTLFTHLGIDAQRLQPRRISSDSSLAAAVINPAAPFGFKIGSLDWMDAAKNPGGKIGIRVWKAIDTKGNIIPNCYIFSNDYLGTSGTNYDYNDNMHFITNVKPEKGASFASVLVSTPSALDFGVDNLQTTDSLNVSIKNSGQTYPDGSSDPAIKISSVQITGQNSSEFSFAMPALTLDPQQASNIKVKFKPTTQGLKIADLLVFYNSSVSPLRIPLYGIGKASATTVTVNYRIKCGSSTAVTVNGKTWSADTYAVDNLEPFSNPSLTQVACTDEDALYLREQSSNANKKPFRYVIPITTNGDYAVRLHFAEGVWGAPGGGYAGGAGSRVMSIKIEGQYRLINFDVAQEVGPATAVIKNFPVTVNDNNLNIDFSATVDRPMVNAIEVYSFSGSPAPPMTKVMDSSSLASNISAVDLVSENNFEKPRVYPNPLSNRFAVQFPGKYQGKYDLQIIDLMGRKYEIGKTILKPGGSNFDIDISRFALNPGVYSLRIHSDTGKADVIKLIVQ